MTKIANETNVDIGISTENREVIAEVLSKVLADSYVLYLKTHNYHWNVTGKLFHSLHEQFEEQYTELAEAIDEIAERIRALGFHAPGTYKEFQQLASIEEEGGQPDAMDMVKRLVWDHEQLLRTVRKALKPAKIADDEATIDLLTQRLNTHSKTAWMLRSHLE
ncbi:DNA starvation/stationary phase protection protein [Aliifodinibius sp. S!AR15-10]|nr:DNA starvation/stationary phase protection protein [Aliifodinibius sp. S!AR15-10]